MPNNQALGEMQTYGKMPPPKTHGYNQFTVQKMIKLGAAVAAVIAVVASLATLHVSASS